MRNLLLNELDIWYNSLQNCCDADTSSFLITAEYELLYQKYSINAEVLPVRMNCYSICDHYVDDFSRR